MSALLHKKRTAPVGRKSNEFVTVLTARPLGAGLGGPLSGQSNKLDGISMMEMPDIMFTQRDTNEISATVVDFQYQAHSTIARREQSVDRHDQVDIRMDAFRAEFGSVTVKGHTVNAQRSIATANADSNMGNNDIFGPKVASSPSIGM